MFKVEISENAELKNIHYEKLFNIVFPSDVNLSVSEKAVRMITFLMQTDNVVLVNTEEDAKTVVELLDLVEEDCGCGS